MRTAADGGCRRPLRSSAAVPRLQVPPEVAEHPLVELGDLGGAAGLHDEALTGQRIPVVEVVQPVGMPHFMKQNVDVVGGEVAHEVLGADPLTPVATRAAAEARGEPERVVVMV